MDTTTNTSIDSTATFCSSHSKRLLDKRTMIHLAEMPIASGAAGRVDAGVDTNTTWTPDGLKRKTKPVNRSCDSYLQRYQEKIRKDKGNLLRGMQDDTEPSDQENDGPKEEHPQENDGSEDHSSGKPSRGERAKKSVLCVLL